MALFCFLGKTIPDLYNNISWNIDPTLGTLFTNWLNQHKWNIEYLMIVIGSETSRMARVVIFEIYIIACIINKNTTNEEKIIIIIHLIGQQSFKIMLQNRLYICYRPPLLFQKISFHPQHSTSSSSFTLITVWNIYMNIKYQQ